MQKDERSHPCEHCRYFKRWVEVETLEVLGLGHPIRVDIPVCGRTTYVFAIGRCDHFVPSELYMEYMQSKIDEYDEMEAKAKAQQSERGNNECNC